MVSERDIKRVLITGMTGSGGSYLAEYLIEHHPQIEVHGISRWHSTTASHNLARVAEKVVVHECDMNDVSSLFSVVREVRPDAVFHLASHANVRASFTNPLAVLNNNIMSTANLLEVVRLAGLNPMIQLCSTSEVYGQVEPQEVPIREETPLRPASPYAVSKVAQDLLGWTYFVSYNMRIVRTRMFAYINPRRTDLFATSFAKQIARIELGLQDELVHGNLDSVRTLIDVRDAMEAYWQAILKCQPGEAYNIGGKTTITVGDFLRLLIQRSKVPIRLRLEPSLLRPADVTLQIPCVDKFAQATGWTPKYTFEESVDFLLAYWRGEVGREADRIDQWAIG